MSVYRTIGPLVLVVFALYINVFAKFDEIPSMILCGGIIEPRHEKSNVLHMRKQRRRSATR